MANRLADMHEIAPDLTQAVAKRITSTDLHDRALRDLGAFVHRTIVEDEHTYAVRIDDGAMLDAAEHIERARTHLTATEREQLAHILACEPDKVDRELDTLTATSHIASASPSERPSVHVIHTPRAASHKRLFRPRRRGYRSARRAAASPAIYGADETAAGS